MKQVHRCLCKKIFSWIPFFPIPERFFLYILGLNLLFFFLHIHHIDMVEALKLLFGDDVGCCSYLKATQVTCCTWVC